MNNDTHAVPVAINSTYLPVTVLDIVDYVAREKGDGLQRFLILSINFLRTEKHS